MRYNKIAIIGAMNEEIESLQQQMKHRNKVEKAGIEFMEGDFFGLHTVVCKSGVGKVNAAVCTQVLIDRFQVEAVLFTGVAGALDPRLNIGDIVISSECMQHDMDVSALGFAKGEIPYAEQSIFPADPELVDIAYEASSRLFSERTVKGRVLSGDQFVADRGMVQMLHEQLNGVCTEMEGAAVAQVCAMNGIPYVVIRSMSDRADGSAHINFAEFTVQASEHSYQIVEEMVKRFAG